MIVGNDAISRTILGAGGIACVVVFFVASFITSNVDIAASSMLLAGSISSFCYLVAKTLKIVKGRRYARKYRFSELDIQREVLMMTQTIRIPVVKVQNDMLQVSRR